MKIFAVVHRFSEDQRYGHTEGKIGVTYIEAIDENDAERKYGYSGVVAVREVSIDVVIGATRK